MENLKKLFMKDWMFIPLLAVMGAGVFTTIYMYKAHGVGSFNGVAQNIFINEKNWAAMSSMGVGFVIARVLEGPMVGLLDIGGGMMVTLGCFAPAMIASFGFEWILDSFITSIVTGAVLGALEAVIIMAIRKLIPDGITAGGSDIMMGVGHQMSQYMGPLFIICALKVSIPLGLAAVVGGAIAYWKGSNVLGGIVIGMFLSSFIWTVAA